MDRHSVPMGRAKENPAHGILDLVFDVNYFFMDMLYMLDRCFSSESQGATARGGRATVVPWLSLG